MNASTVVENKKNKGVIAGIKSFVDTVLLITELAILSFYVICATVAIINDRLPIMNGIVLAITLIYAMFYILQFRRHDKSARERKLIVKKIYTFARVSLALAIKIVGTSIILYTAMQAWDGISVLTFLLSIGAAIFTAVSLVLSILDFILTAILLRQKRRVEAATQRAKDRVVDTARVATEKAKAVTVRTKNALGTAAGKVTSVFKRKDKTAAELPEGNQANATDGAAPETEAPVDTEE
ncbi:MAG: hypothetical protein IKV43_00655 [Clostridia bacterium]|nr:hypothetical protein [Clostridia bacterium]